MDCNNLAQVTVNTCKKTSETKAQPIIFNLKGQ